MNLPKNFEAHFQEQKQQQEEDPAVQVEFEQFNLQNVQVGNFILLINNNEFHNVDYVNTLISLHLFHFVDVYTLGTQTFGKRFLYPCKTLSATEINSHLGDVLQRHYYDSLLHLKQQEAKVGSVTTPTVSIKDRIFSLHPHTFTHISAQTLKKINQFLFLPRSCIVFHDLSFSDSLKLTVQSSHFYKWFKSTTVNNVITQIDPQQQLFRIVTAKSTDKLPTTWVEKADYVFIFKPTTAVEIDSLLRLYHIYFTSVFHSFDIFQDLLANLKPKQACVILPWWKVFTFNDLTNLRPLCVTYPLRVERVKWCQF